VCVVSHQWTLIWTLGLCFLLSLCLTHNRISVTIGGQIKTPPLDFLYLLNIAEPLILALSLLLTYCSVDTWDSKEELDHILIRPPPPLLYHLLNSTWHCGSVDGEKNRKIILVLNGGFGMCHCSVMG
jgi:hypothetical protein